MATLNHKLEQMAHLGHLLNRSISLQQWMPDCFDHGTCRVSGRGNIEHDPLNAVIIFTFGNGAKRQLPMVQVPYALWPQSMRDEWHRIPKWRKPKLTPLPKHGEQSNG